MKRFNLCSTLFILIYTLLTGTQSFAQSGAAINTTGTAADPSAILDVSSTNSGLLIPRMTKNNKNSIPQPAVGLMIYQTDDTTGFWYYNGILWKLVGTEAGEAISAGTFAGNTLYWNGSQWTESSNIYNAGNSVGIGTNNPDVNASLDLGGTSKGFLINRLSTAERNAIVNPTTGLQIYNITNNCLEIFIPPVWQSIFCGCSVPSASTPDIHSSFKTEITWNWTSVPNTYGYKFNTINDYNSATDNGINTSYTQSNLNCETMYNLYIWAYNNCGHSNVTILTDTTTMCFNCGVENLSDNRDGKTYQTVKIGNQCWMKENLNFDQNSFGDDWCYAGNASYCNTYGRLYNWEAAMAGSASSSSNPSGVQGVCPSGWHLPSDAEWTDLSNYLGGEIIAGAKLKESGTTNWISPNTGATNSTGFTALPGGYYNSNNYSFWDINYDGYFWSSTEYNATQVWRRFLDYNYAGIVRDSGSDKTYGYSIRCIKN